MVRAVRIPVTVKMRTGWIRLRTARRRSSQGGGGCGRQSHHRARQDAAGHVQRRGGSDAIARVKRAVRVPVLGNGSILSPQDAIAMIRKTGVDALMIGRGAVGNPWIFSRLLHWLKTGELPPPPGLMEKKEMTLRHLELLREVLGERLAAFHSRKHLPAYMKGLRGGSAMRERVNRMTDMDAVLREVEIFFDNLVLRARVTAAGESAHAA